MRCACRRRLARADDDTWDHLHVEITRLNPKQLHRTAGYAHVTIVDCGRLAIIAGQCPLDRDGQLVGRGNVLAQIDQIASNAEGSLTAAGATAGDVIRSAIYVVSADSAVLASVWDRFISSSIGAAFTTASTLIGVTSLGYDDQLVELDLTAALAD